MAILLQTHWAPEFGCMSDVQEWNSQTPPSDPFINERASVKLSSCQCKQILAKFSLASKCNQSHVLFRWLHYRDRQAPKLRHACHQVRDKYGSSPTGSSAMELALQREQLPQYSTATRNVQHVFANNNK